jgi:hypothetical protein
MSATLHVLPPPPDDGSKEAALRMLEMVRGHIEAGQVVMFAAVGLAKNDDLTMYVGGGGKTKVQVMGAIQGLSSSYFTKVASL